MIRPARLALLLASAVLVGACSTSGSATAVPAATGASTAMPAATTGAGSTAGAIVKVSASSATQEELVAALTAAGVPSPDRWAREIMEYRPYAADDLTLQKLQDNLAKYNPDPATLAGILSVLVP